MLRMDNVSKDILKSVIACATLCSICFMYTKDEPAVATIENGEHNIMIPLDEPKVIPQKVVKKYTPPTNILVNGKDIDFKSIGVVKRGGIRYTYYSSNVLRHYRINEWLAGDDGLWRTTDGYIVVASKMHPKNAIIPTPFGRGKVLDYCETDGTVDIYVNF